MKRTISNPQPTCPNCGGLHYGSPKGYCPYSTATHVIPAAPVSPEKQALARCPICLSDSRRYGNMRPCNSKWHTERPAAPVSRFWGDPAGNIRRMDGDQEIVATVTKECTNAEWIAFCSVHSDLDPKVSKAAKRAKEGK